MVNKRCTANYKNMLIHSRRSGQTTLSEALVTLNIALIIKCCQKHLENAETLNSERAEYAKPKHCTCKTTLKVAVRFLRVTRTNKEKRQYQRHEAQTQ